MSDATIATLLEELREVDETIALSIQYGVVFGKGLDESRVPYESMGVQMAHDHLQGCIQRAIAGRIETGTFAGYMLLYDLMGCEATITMGEEHDYDDIEERADTPAVAVLAAYIEAVRASK